ncbi:MAG: lipopolysaccharide transport periplasmic protein LptA [Gammaproteobacteria bacterium]|nr:lipopolysaccharide transport periplasmic protein LptA [Gammaproteobacteria bacterium]
MSRRNKSRCLLLVCAWCIATSAWALKSDGSQPIHVQADHVDFQNDTSKNSGTGIYSGHVVITQGSIRITADRAVLLTQDNQVQSADITGAPATFQQRADNGVLSHGMASEIIYSADKNLIVLRGNALVQQGERQMTGDKIKYNTRTQHVVAIGGESSGGRVNITLPPKAATAAPQTKKHKHKQKPPVIPPPSAGASQNGIA